MLCPLPLLTCMTTIVEKSRKLGLRLVYKDRLYLHLHYSYQLFFTHTNSNRGGTKRFGCYSAALISGIAQERTDIPLYAYKTELEIAGG